MALNIICLVTIGVFVIVVVVLLNKEINKEILETGRQTEKQTDRQKIILYSLYNQSLSTCWTVSLPDQRILQNIWQLADSILSICWEKTKFSVQFSSNIDITPNVCSRRASMRTISECPGGKTKWGQLYEYDSNAQWDIVFTRIHK